MLPPAAAAAPQRMGMLVLLSAASGWHTGRCWLPHAACQPPEPCLQ